MKKLLCMIIVIVLVVAIALVPATAALPPYIVGDVDCDYRITIIDATRAQRVVAKLDEADTYVKKAADVDFDREISIMDATIIQQYVAEIINGFDADYSDKYFREAIVINDVISSKPIDEIYVGDEIEFSVDYDIFSGIHKSDYIDIDYLIEYEGEHYYSVMGGVGAGYFDINCDFNYVGNYKFTVIVRNQFNDRDTYSFGFVVQDKV